MQRFGKGLVFFSAIAWSFAGAIVFLSGPSADPPRVADYGTSVRLTANASFGYDESSLDDKTTSDTSVVDGSGSDQWEGPYYFAKNQSQGVVYTGPIDQKKPWYKRVFGGFGAMFDRLTPRGNEPAAGYTPSVNPVTSDSGSSFPPACVISITPNSVPYGGSATVSWTSRNSDHVIFQGIGEVARSGTLPVSQLTSTRALALAVVGPEGASSCYTVVNVEPLVVDTPACVISAHPSEVKRGESVNLSWGSDNAILATLSGQGVVGTVGGTTVTPLKSTTYTLTVKSVLGEPVSCTTSVSVQ